jgi:hypothetical protein
MRNIPSVAASPGMHYCYSSSAGNLVHKPWYLFKLDMPIGAEKILLSKDHTDDSCGPHNSIHRQQGVPELFVFALSCQPPKTYQKNHRFEDMNHVTDSIHRLLITFWKEKGPKSHFIPCKQVHEDVLRHVSQCIAYRVIKSSPPETWSNTVSVFLILIYP